MITLVIHYFVTVVYALNENSKLTALNECIYSNL